MTDLEKVCKGFEEAVEKFGEQMRSEFGELFDKLNELAEQWEEQEQEQDQEQNTIKLEYPNVGQDYYFMSVASGTIGIIKDTWHGYPIDYARWNFCHGAYNKYRVMWTIEHIKLVNEIKKHARPFVDGEQNWYFEISIASYNLITDFDTEYFHANEYGYFNNQEEAKKVIEQLDEEYILKFLFRPTDGNYKAVMNWLADQEEE